jgi:lipopolysaccharide biosynthesis glycosyltransferase
MELLLTHPHEATFADQGALNAVLAGAWMPLDNRWNVQVRRSASVCAFGRVMSRHSLVKTTDLSILHFVGILKPWEPDYAPSAYRRMYADAYRRFAPFAPELDYWNPLSWARSRR